MNLNQEAISFSLDSSSGLNSALDRLVAGAHFSSDTDIEAMLAKMARQMEKIAKESVGRAIGQGRT